MARLASSILLAAALLAACGPKSPAVPAKEGPFVAQGNGIAITTEELKALIAQQPAILQPFYATPEGKKMMLDELIRFELIAAAAQKAGLANDPAVQLAARGQMITKYTTKMKQTLAATQKVPDDDVKKYYDEQAEDYLHPLRVHAAYILVKAPAAGPARAAQHAKAEALLRRILAEEKRGNGIAFSLVARERSDDAVTKQSGGDLLYQTKDALEKSHGRETAEAIFSLADNQTAARVLPGPLGFHLVHVYGRQEAESVSLEEAKPEIVAILSRDLNKTAWEDFQKKLLSDVAVDDAALDEVTAAAEQGASAQQVAASASSAR